MKAERTPAQSELDSPQRRSIGRRILARLGVGRGVKASTPVESVSAELAEPQRGVDAATEKSIRDWTEKAESLGADPYRPQYAGSGVRRPSASYRPPQNLTEPYVPGVGNVDPSLDPFAQTNEQQPAMPGGPEAWKEAGHPAAPQIKGRGEQ